jgi:aquaporin Z
MRNPWNAVIAEILGTFLFFFIGIGAAGWVSRATVSGLALDPSSSLLVIALAHGVALAVMVSSLGAVSGAHFNPAVTTGVWIAGQIPGRRAVSYVIAQLIGALLAAWSLRVLFPADQFPELGIPRLTGIDPLQGVAVETVLTVILMIAVFGTAIDPRAPKVGGLVIGFAVAVDIMMGGPLTGAAMNPARWFGPAAVIGDYSNSAVWIVGPVAGAVIAALLYRFMFLPEADPERTPADPTA